MNDTTMTADEVIRLLDLAPHPEGGHYRETFRDANCDADGRARSTAIYFLLAAGESSHWHRVDAVETWFWHAGGPLTLRISDDGVETRDARLGPDIAAGEAPQVTIPQGSWQAAEPLGAWTLVSCTVAPGFVFEGFELAPPDWTPGKDQD